MTSFQKWLKTQGRFNTLQELYAITLEGNHGRNAVRDWIDGKEEYYDETTEETIKFLLPPPFYRREA